jgi:hypothetical protein
VTGREAKRVCRLAKASDGEAVSSGLPRGGGQQRSNRYDRQLVLTVPSALIDAEPWADMQVVGDAECDGDRAQRRKLMDVLAGDRHEISDSRK